MEEEVPAHGKVSPGRMLKEAKMGTKEKQLISSALQMPKKVRATIAERLIASLDPHCDKDTETIWQKEVQQRISDIDSGRVNCIPWENVRERLRRNSSA